MEGLREGEVTLDAQASRYLLCERRARTGDATVLFDPVPARIE
jgi:hypothetical protein